MKTALIIAIAVAAGATLATRTAQAEPVPFPTVRYGKADLHSVAATVEHHLGMPGFANFAISVAHNESNFKSWVVDDSPSAVRAARNGLKNNAKRYANTPWPRSWYTFGTGGWYQLLPTSALSDTVWNDANPLLVFAPYASTFLLAAFVQRVQRNHFGNFPPQERNWLAVRRFMLNNAAGYDWSEQLPKTQGKRERYAEDLRSEGIDPNFMFELVPSSIRATPTQYQALLDTLNIQQERLQ